MKTVELSADVYCYTKEHDYPRYRIYLDDELITERTFSWSSVDTYVEEHGLLTLSDGPHVLRVESVTTHPGRFILKNIKINDTRVNASFTI